MYSIYLQNLLIALVGLQISIYNDTPTGQYLMNPFSFTIYVKTKILKTSLKGVIFVHNIFCKQELFTSPQKQWHFDNMLEEAHLTISKP